MIILNAPFFMYQIGATATFLLMALCIFNSRNRKRLERYGQETMTGVGIYLLAESILRGLTSLHILTATNYRNTSTFFSVLAIVAVIGLLMLKERSRQDY